MGADDSPVSFVSSAIFARQDFLDSNKSQVRSFLKAIGKGSDWIRANPAQAEVTCLDSGASLADCKTAVNVATTSKNPFTWSSNTGINGEGIKGMIPIVAAAVPKAKDMPLSEFIDISLTD